MSAGFVVSVAVLAFVGGVCVGVLLVMLGGRRW